MKKDDIKELLPHIVAKAVRDDSLLDAFLSCMELLHESSEATIRGYKSYYDLLNADQEHNPLLPYMARWFGMEKFITPANCADSSNETPESNFKSTARDLIVNAMWLYKNRGSKEGIKSFLEIATGIGGFKVSESTPGGNGGPGRPFHMVIIAPMEVTTDRRTMIEHIIERQKPAYATYELEFRTPEKEEAA